jgi:hypothetical protein
MLMGGQEVAMIFADIRLRGVMDGIDLAREVKVRWPHLSVSTSRRWTRRDCCLVVLGRHVERLEFHVMFGDRPALSPPEIFYQRMLAGDPAEAIDKAEEFQGKVPLRLLR